MLWRKNSREISEMRTNLKNSKMLTKIYFQIFYYYYNVISIHIFNSKNKIIKCSL